MTLRCKHCSRNTRVRVCMLTGSTSIRCYSCHNDNCLETATIKELNCRGTKYCMVTHTSTPTYDTNTYICHQHLHMTPTTTYSTNTYIYNQHIHMSPTSTKSTYIKHQHLNIAPSSTYVTNTHICHQHLRIAPT